MASNSKYNRKLLFTAQKGKCKYCQKVCKLPESFGQAQQDSFTIDHIIPLSKGGSNLLSNLQGLCWLCNAEKANKIIPQPKPIGSKNNFTFIKHPPNHMPYKISISRIEENTSYEEQKKAYEEEPRYVHGLPKPKKFLLVRKLQTVLTDSEFDAVRKACLGQV